MGNHCHRPQMVSEDILSLWWKLGVSLYIPKGFYLIAKRVSG